MAYHLRIKICGVTTAADAKEAVRLGADAIGINFASESPRSASARAALEIVQALPPFIEPVGVFVNRPIQAICQDLNNLGGIRTLQWHGDSQNREVSDPFPFRLIAAFQVRDQRSLLEIDRYLNVCRSVGTLPCALLLDGYSSKQHGGTGQKAPWDLLSDFRPEDVPIVLAGGLTQENVYEAVQKVRPYGVDVASGVESSPGQKDPNKMARFIYNARLAAAQLR